jgi:hypothetical protein
MDSITIKGIITIDIIDVKTNKVKQHLEFKNILTTNGLKMHRNWAAGVPPLSDPDYNVDTRITNMAVGDGNSVPLIGQTALDNELLRKALYPVADTNCGIELSGTNEVIYTIFIDKTELNGYIIREIGLFSETFTDFMVSRFLCGNLSKNSTVQFLIKYRLSFNNAV